jgi:hemoglobin
MKKNILHLEDIQTLVDAFYEKVRGDSLLSPVFGQVIQDRWPEHLEKMYRFWQTVLLDERTYEGSPFPPHSRLPVNAEHFARWMKLFIETVDENFSGEVAEDAKWRAQKMADMFMHKIAYFQKKSGKTCWLTLQLSIY